MRKFPQHTKTGDLYGPTNPAKSPEGIEYPQLMYQPKPDHRKTARKKKDKTRWILDEDQEYEVFRYSDEELNWGHSGEMLAIYLDDNNKLEVLGENDCRVAKFPEPQNIADPWHGYPTDEYEFDEDVLLSWVDKGLINETTRRRLLKSAI